MALGSGLELFVCTVPIKQINIAAIVILNRPCISKNGEQRGKHLWLPRAAFTPLSATNKHERSLDMLVLKTSLLCFYLCRLFMRIRYHCRSGAATRRRGAALTVAPTRGHQLGPSVGGPARDELITRSPRVAGIIKLLLLRFLFSWSIRVYMCHWHDHMSLWLP